MDVVVAPARAGVAMASLDRQGRPGARTEVDWDDLPDQVTSLERHKPRWVWPDTAAMIPPLLQAGLQVGRAHDLRLSHAILSRIVDCTPPPGQGPCRWDAPSPAVEREPTLLDLADQHDTIGLDDVAAEHQRQQRIVAASTEPPRLRLLLAAESAGALVAAELTHIGLPFDVDAHEALLVELLGPRPLPGGRPPRLEGLADRVRTLLQVPGLNPDSGPDLLRALRGQGIGVESTRSWELERVQHPVVEPLLEYKKLSRLASANGWAWRRSWVRQGRFRPAYVPAGVVTGRWATSGGGALQLPRQVRAAVVASPGCRLVVADAAQLEPRVLAAMARDESMARAARAGDLYQTLVEQGVVDTRGHAKTAMLGALYGATAGEAGQLMPRLQRTFPLAIALVEEAARAGERGEVVTTWLGRTSPPPPESWHEGQRRASLPEATAGDQRRARSQAREWGRFTRNFVVQGTAAEWALCWLADLRLRLRELGEVEGRRPALVYFLHDEVIVETPEELTGPVAAAVRQAARRAGTLLFGRFPVEFPLEVACVHRYDEAS